MTLKNTDQASAKLIRIKFNMLVLTIQDDLLGLYGYKKTLIFWQKKQRWSQPKMPNPPPPPKKKKKKKLGPLVELNRQVFNI